MRFNAYVHLHMRLFLLLLLLLLVVVFWLCMLLFLLTSFYIWCANWQANLMYSRAMYVVCSVTLWSF